MPPVVLVLHWLPDGVLEKWKKQFPQVEFVDALAPEVFDKHVDRATITYGIPDVAKLSKASSLQWIQLASAGVPWNLCDACKGRKLDVTNLAGLYGPTIAEHALCMLLFLNRNLQSAFRNQLQGKWDRSVAGPMRDLFGKTLAVVGAGNIGQNIARLAKGFGMQVLGCRRRPKQTPFVDIVFGPGEVKDMLGRADYVAVAAPLTRGTDGMLGVAEFAAMRPGTIYVNVSRGPIAQEAALLEALRSGQIAAAGLDVFAVEPLAPEHPFWAMPNVLVSPHFSGETVNTGTLPSERFARNLRAWLDADPLEGIVDVDQGY
ncbi:MAG: D-2-hydroxyacid dehydrogenase [Gemmataceae bacterium]|nr:D-2-hydroxyacid dehydrogenase [Gemmataceae bacterium]MCI0738073.1 D-2-hydroxyacid dehydrogenase [Gemmataceae bacterium]